MRFRGKKSGKPLILLILVAAAIAVFSVSAYASYHPTVTIMGRVTHGTEPVWGVVVTANTTNEQGVPTGSGAATTDYVGFYQIVLDQLDPDASYYVLKANYSDYLGVNYRGIANGELSSGISTINILLTNESERAAPLSTVTPVPTPASTASATPEAPEGGSEGPCCGLLALLLIAIVVLVTGGWLWRRKK